MAWSDLVALADRELALARAGRWEAVSYTHLRAHET